MELRSTHDPNALSRAQGLEGKEISSPSGRGRKISLTSPLIDQAISQACAVSSPVRPLAWPPVIHYGRAAYGRNRSVSVEVSSTARFHVIRGQRLLPQGAQGITGETDDL